MRYRGDPVKPCIKCGAVKSLGEFYTHPGMADGYLNACKACVRAYRNLQPPHAAFPELTGHRDP